jgi:hypothetical protein
MVTGILIKTDGTVENFEQQEGESLLHGMYRALEVDMVELVQLTDEIGLWLDEEGLYSGQVPNLYATALGATLGFRNPWGVPLMGPVLVLGGCDDEGDTLSLSDEDAQRIRGAIASVREREALEA